MSAIVKTLFHVTSSAIFTAASIEIEQPLPHVRHYQNIIPYHFFGDFHSRTRRTGRIRCADAAGAGATPLRAGSINKSAQRVICIACSFIFFLNVRSYES
ncbi:MAG: hypothetical protein LBT64_03775 [Puniceicoccales bacterium]|nr:hypothetical protein [Puniceicoccales bacterium]